SALGGEMLFSAYQNRFIEAGCDEAGRGCLAGPVFAAAVIFPPDFKFIGINDSKKLTEMQRYGLREIIQKEAVAYAVTQIDAGEMSCLNILDASVFVFNLALTSLPVGAEFLIIDGNRFKPYNSIPHECIIQGDGKYLSVAAASILAKPYRDNFMSSPAIQYP